MKSASATGRVFISHSGQDNELVREIARRLRNAGFEPLVDFDDVRSGAEWKKLLRERLREADTVLMLVTPAALRSSWTMTELGMAEGFDLAVLPVIAGLKPRDLPEPLKSFRAVPFDQLDDAIGELSESLAPASPD